MQLSNALETGDLQVLTRGPALVFFVPAFVWLLYIALEPHIRRVWPETMIGWSRLLAGSVRDPLVGRDVLVGVLVAIGDGLILALHTLLRRWSGRPPQFPVGASSNPFDGMAASSDLLLGGRYALSRIIGSVMSIPVWGGTMLTFLLLFVLYVLLRRRSLAMAAMILGLTAIYVVTHGGWLLANAPADHFAPSVADVVLFAAVQTAIVLVAVRFGLLTMLVASFVSVLLTLHADRHRLVGAVRLVVSPDRGDGDRTGRLWLAYRAGRPPDVWRLLPQGRTRPPRLIRETSRFPQARIASRRVIVASRRRS